ncbi:hypothetical protein [Cryobacterium breve]|nr:hypothetical protein [Cryobacterium breve]
MTRTITRAVLLAPVTGASAEDKAVTAAEAAWSRAATGATE